MFILKINPERCKACGLCIHFCPTGGLDYSQEFNAAGYHPVRQADPEKCTGCRQCVLMCPDVAIEIFKFVPTDTGETPVPPGGDTGETPVLPEEAKAE